MSLIWNFIDSINWYIFRCAVTWIIIYRYVIDIPLFWLDTLCLGHMPYENTSIFSQSFTLPWFNRKMSGKSVFFINNHTPLLGYRISIISIRCPTIIRFNWQSENVDLSICRLSMTSLIQNTSIIVATGFNKYKSSYCRIGKYSEV